MSAAPLHLRLDRVAAIVRSLAAALDSADMEPLDVRDGLDHVHDALRGLAVELENATRERAASAHGVSQ